MIFFKRGYKTVHNEMKHLHGKEATIPVKPKNMSRNIRREALKYLIFVKDKINGTIKISGCTDGNNKFHKIRKLDATSPVI